MNSVKKVSPQIGNSILHGYNILKEQITKWNNDKPIEEPIKPKKMVKKIVKRKKVRKTIEDVQIDTLSMYYNDQHIKKKKMVKKIVKRKKVKKVIEDVQIATVKSDYYFYIPPRTKEWYSFDIIKSFIDHINNNPVNYYESKNYFRFDENGNNPNFYFKYDFQGHEVTNKIYIEFGKYNTFFHETLTLTIDGSIYINDKEMTIYLVRNNPILVYYFKVLKIYYNKLWKIDTKNYIKDTDHPEYKETKNNIYKILRGYKAIKIPVHKSKSDLQRTNKISLYHDYTTIYKIHIFDDLISKLYGIDGEIIEINFISNQYKYYFHFKILNEQNEKIKYSLSLDDISEIMEYENDDNAYTYIDIDSNDEILKNKLLNVIDNFLLENRFQLNKHQQNRIRFKGRGNEYDEEVRDVYTPTFYFTYTKSISYYKVNNFIPIIDVFGSGMASEIYTFL